MNYRKFWVFAISVVVGSTLCGTVLSVSTTQAEAGRPMLISGNGVADNAELAKAFQQDQVDRAEIVLGKRTCEHVKQAEAHRLAFALRLVTANKLSTSGDFFRAATIVQRSERTDDILLAHDLAQTAVSMGEKQASIVAASTEDRFLLSRGMHQRFGTQYQSSGGGRQLAPVDRAVTDAMRAGMGVPKLADAQALSLIVLPTP